MSPLDLTDEARRQLERLWRSADDPDAVADAVAALDRRIRSDPKAGESRGDAGKRVAFEPPLGVEFFEPGPDAVIRVTKVWRF